MKRVGRKEIKRLYPYNYAEVPPESLMGVSASEKFL
jgi:hypothetical protein